MHGGGKFDTFELPDHSRLVLTSDADGIVTTVRVENQETSSLGFTLDQWPQLFQKYGLPSLGDPTETAPLASIWYWQTDATRYKIRMVSENMDTRKVWQVQIEKLR